MKVAEFCTGTGAFTMASEKAGFEVVYANDFVKESRNVYEKNFPGHIFIEQDIHDINPASVPPMDILTAGFPCQPFSVAGNRQGFDDTRSNVFWKLMSIVDFHKPRVLIFENVKNLVSHDNGNTFKVIAEEITKRGYKLFHRILETSAITGIPHNRERIFIIAFQGIDVSYFPWPAEVDNIRDLNEYLDEAVHDKYAYTEKSAIWDKLHEGVTKMNTVYQYRRYYVRENKSGVCPTLTANMGTGGHNVPIILTVDGKIRKLTPRECFRLQGFPDEYTFPEGMSDAKLYKLAGNAVTLGVVERLMQSIRTILNS